MEPVSIEDPDEVSVLQDTAEAPDEASGIQDTAQPISQCCCFSQELESLARLAVPSCASYVLQFGVGLANVVVTARLGVIELDGAALGQLLANVTGFSIIIGLLMAMDTLAPQAFGAGHQKLVGTLAQRALLIVTLVTMPVMALWWTSEPLLLLLHQDPEVSRLASLFLRTMSFALPPACVFEVVRKFLQAQQIVLPVTLITGVGLLVHIPTIYLLVFYFELGFIGAPMANAISNTLNAALAVGYVLWAGPDGPLRCWGGWSREALQGWAVFLRLGVPSLIQVAAEWWAFEAVTLMAGLLGAEQLGASSIIMQLIVIMFMFPLSVSSAASTRVGHLLGQGHPAVARKSAQLALWFSVWLGSGLFVFTLSVIELWPWLFTSDSGVQRLVSRVLPLVAFSQWFDSMQVTLSGVLRGVGQQAKGAMANVVAQWLVGVPAAAVFAFGLDWGILGLWGGIGCGTVLQVVLQGVLVCKVDWVLMADDAHMRSAESIPCELMQQECKSGVNEDSGSMVHKLESVELIGLGQDQSDDVIADHHSSLK